MKPRKTRKPRKPNNLSEKEYIKLFAEVLIWLSEQEEWIKMVENLNKDSIHKQIEVETVLNQMFDLDPF
ncbi:MAG: hypothetical protein RL736_358 [Pseudomonadota bacterium]|jgi:hypothetical protein